MGVTAAAAARVVLGLGHLRPLLPELRTLLLLAAAAPLTPPMEVTLSLRPLLLQEAVLAVGLTARMVEAAGPAAAAAAAPAALAPAARARPAEAAAAAATIEAAAAAVQARQVAMQRLAATAAAVTGFPAHSAGPRSFTLAGVEVLLTGGHPAEPAGAGAGATLQALLFRVLLTLVVVAEGIIILLDPGGLGLLLFATPTLLRTQQAQRAHRH